jgi:hypothetical protein
MVVASLPKAESSLIKVVDIVFKDTIEIDYILY